jgi:hypothetical protein
MSEYGDVTLPYGVLPSAVINVGTVLGPFVSCGKVCLCQSLTMGIALVSSTVLQLGALRRITTSSLHILHPIP